MRTYLMDVLGTGQSGHETAVLVIGSMRPDQAEKIQCVDLVARLVDEGWLIAAHSTTPIGRLVQRATHAAGGRYVDVDHRDRVGPTPAVSPVLLPSVFHTVTR